MKFIDKSFFLLLSWMFILQSLTAQQNDSIKHLAEVLAAKNDYISLRNLYKNHHMVLPDHTRLYCELSFARAKNDVSDIVIITDSLIHHHADKLNVHNRLSMIVLQAQALRSMGKYEELIHLCVSEKENLQRLPITAKETEILTFFEKKAKQLSDTTLRARMLSLADMQNIYELDHLLEDSCQYVDTYTRLVCDFTRSQAFHHEERMKQCIDSLTTHYKDSLDYETLNRLLKCKAELLCSKGAWKLLVEWAENIEHTYPQHYPEFAHYKKMGEELKNQPSTQFTFPTGHSEIPVTYESPMLTAGSINGMAPTALLIDIMQEHTFIHEADAKKYDSKIIADTLWIPSSYGWLQVSPGYIHTFTIGNIQINHLQIYVVLDSSPNTENFIPNIGTSILRQFGKITFHREKAVVTPFSTEKRNHDGKKRNLCWSPMGTLQTCLYWEGEPYLFDLHTLQTQNILPGEDFRMGTSIPNELPIEKHISSLSPPTHPGKQQRNAARTGILGLSFLRASSFFEIDFHNMILEKTGEERYQPLRYVFDADTDGFYLERNYPAFMLGNDLPQEEKWFLQAMITRGKNQPDSMLSICQELRKANSPYYDAAAEAECLFELGKHQEAAEFAIKTLKNRENLWIDDIQQKRLKQMAAFRGESDFKPAHIAKNVLPLDEDGCVEIIVNNKKKNAYLSPTEALTMVSERHVKKMGIKSVYKNKTVHYGIIPKLTIGTSHFYHIPCKIIPSKDPQQRYLPNKGKGILIGFQVLKHFRWFSSYPQYIVVGEEPLGFTSPSKRLRMHHSLNIEIENKNSYETLEINHEQWKSIQENLTIDFKTLNIWGWD